jgi:hypothetical protein
MFSRSILSAVGTTGFYVPRWTWRHYCLVVSRRVGRVVATRGYPGSHLFHEGTFGIDAIALVDPTGKRYTLTNGTTIQLKQPGFWTVAANYQNDYTSGWAENSGYFDISDNADFAIARC